MSNDAQTMFDNAGPVPKTEEFGFVGLSYFLFAIGLFTAIAGLLGLIVAYVRRSGARGTLLESHYSWLIRSFWTAIILWVGSVCAIVAIVVTRFGSLRAVPDTNVLVNLPWGLLASLVCIAIFMSLVWFWMIYRLIKGALRLADGRAAG